MKLKLKLKLSTQQGDKKETVVLLVDSGASLGIRNKHGLTPPEVAVRLGRTEMLGMYNRNGKGEEEGEKEEEKEEEGQQQNGR